MVYKEPKENWREVISGFYSLEENEFFYRHHKCGGEMGECVDDMMATISDNAELFSVYVGMGLGSVGFFVKTEYEGQYVLEGFHIKKGCRVSVVIQKFWAAVKKTFAHPFFIGIYEGNTPALKHLLRNGFEELGDTESEGKRFILLHNKLI